MADATEEAAEVDVQKLNLIASLASRSPMLALGASFVLAGGVGAFMSAYIDPLVDDALEQHEDDNRAHDIDRLEERLAAIEAELAEQGKDTAAARKDLSEIRRLISRQTDN